MSTSPPTSSIPLRRITIAGVGAVGGVFAAWLGSRLPTGQVELNALARGQTLQALQRDGLRWLGDDGQEQRVPINAQSDAQALGEQDLVIVAVKGQAMPALAQQIRPLLAPHTIVLVAMNGLPWWFFDGLGGPCDGMALTSVDPGGLIAAALPVQHVLGCVVHASMQSSAPGCIERIRNNQLIIGEPAGGVSERVQAVAMLMEQAGFGVKCSPCIQQDIWFKLWGNMTMNPVSALTGATCDQILDDPLVRGYCSAVMLEAQAIGARIGCSITQTPDDRHAITRAMGAFKTSMLQDVLAGRAIELDGLVASVREVAQHLGLSTPYLDALLGLTRLMAKNRRLS